VTASPPATLADVLVLRASDGHSDRMITYPESDSTATCIGGEQLLKRAQNAAAVLRSNGVAAGDRVLLMLVRQADFADAFFGTIWAGAIPVPLVPPLFAMLRDDFNANFDNIVRVARAAVLVADDAIGRKLARLTSDLAGGIPRLTPQSLVGNGERLEMMPSCTPDDLALLQFTSGSTSAPKGVALTHANVIANVRAIGRATELSQTDVGVSWLPLYHDMGLVGLLATLYHGGSAVLLSPRDFAKNPACWLHALSNYRGTLSPAPNFAFRRCAQLHDQELVGLDLSSWRVAFNGSESVDADTADAFVNRFAPYGFRPSALYPVYGLAEHTLAVSFPPLGAGLRIDRVDRSRLAAANVAESVMEEHEDAASFVSVGTPLSGVTVEIRDDNGVSLPEGHVGEVTVKSACVMAEYFGDPEATRDVLAEGWLRTGDFGYVKDAMLYITGRIKDLIIRAGRNYYPEDIEGAAAGISQLCGGRVAAFAIPADDGTERVAVLAESTIAGGPRRDELIQQITTAVAQRVGFRPELVMLVAKGTLPVTSSGKVRRQETRARFLSGDLQRRRLASSAEDA
jgi:acyl-CoA synthetase (AMP-forming)/AMP-acid ligase II